MFINMKIISFFLILFFNFSFSSEIVEEKEIKRHKFLSLFIPNNQSFFTILLNSLSIYVSGEIIDEPFYSSLTKIGITTAGTYLIGLLMKIKDLYSQEKIESHKKMWNRISKKNFMLVWDDYLKNNNSLSDEQKDTIRNAFCIINEDNLNNENKKLQNLKLLNIGSINSLNPLLELSNKEND